MINLDTDQAIKIERMGGNEAMNSTLCLAATAIRTTIHVCVRAAGHVGDHFDFMDESQYGQREAALLTRAEEVASYFSQHPMFAEGVCSMEEDDWLEIARAVRHLMLHQQRARQTQMVTPTVSSNESTAISPLHTPSPVAQSV